MDNTENSPNYLNIRLKHPTQPKKESISPQSKTKFSNKFENYEQERQQKLQRLRDEYEEKERESMIQCTKPIKRNQKSSSSSSTPKKQVKNSLSNYNDEESSPMTNSKGSISYENSHDDIFSNKSKKNTYNIDDSNLFKKYKYQERRNKVPPEFWDNDGSLLNTNRIQSSRSSALQNEDEFFIDLPPSPKRVEPKGKYPSLVERAINSEKNKTADSSSINSPNSTKSNSPYSTKNSSPHSTKSNSPFSTKSTTSASFKEFEERQQRYREQRENQRKEAEQKIFEEANRSYTLPKSKKLYKRHMQRNGDPIRQKKKDEEEVEFTHIPDTSISRKRIKDQPLGSIVKPWEIDPNMQQEEDQSNTDKPDINNNDNNSKKNNEKSFRIEDVEAHYISREVKLRSMQIEEEVNKVLDCTFTPEKFSKYKLSNKASSPTNPNKYIENADKQMARSRLSGQKIREEEEISKLNEAKDAQFVHKKAKIPNTTKKLINLVSELKREDDDERYKQKNDSLYDRSVATMKRRNGQKSGSSLNDLDIKIGDESSSEEEDKI